jgi:cytidylate kinase
MKKEYDFSKGVRGKFYKKGLTVRIPIYLDAKLQNQLERIARKKGQDIEELVNKLLKKEIELMSELS